MLVDSTLELTIWSCIYIHLYKWLLSNDLSGPWPKPGKVGTISGLQEFTASNISESMRNVEVTPIGNLTGNLIGNHVSTDVTGRSLSMSLHWAVKYPTTKMTPLPATWFKSTGLTFFIPGTSWDLSAASATHPNSYPTQVQHEFKEAPLVPLPDCFPLIPPPAPSEAALVPHTTHAFIIHPEGNLVQAWRLDTQINPALVLFTSCLPLAMII